SPREYRCIFGGKAVPVRQVPNRHSEATSSRLFNPEPAARPATVPLPGYATPGRDNSLCLVHHRGRKASHITNLHPAGFADGSGLNERFASAISVFVEFRESASIPPLAGLKGDRHSRRLIDFLYGEMK